MSQRLSGGAGLFFALARAAGSGSYDVGQFLDALCDEIRTAFGFDRALLARYDEERRTVHAFVLQGIEWPGEEWLDVDRFPFLERALAERRAVCVEDAEEQAALPHALIERFGVRSLVTVPLLIEGRCLGFIVADRAGMRFRVRKKDLELLTGVGLVAAVFIDRADQHAELERALDELRTLDQAKSDFISIASHELRTPVAIVYGITSTLHERADALPAEQQEELRRMLFEQSERLRTLTEQLLDMSRIDAGALKVTSEPFNPRQIVDGLVHRLASDREADVAVEIDPQLEVTSDPHAFERVLANLLLNALRYGQPPVIVSCASNPLLQFVVEDRGVGVEPEFVPDLFKRFSRGERSRREAREGAGLGLAIASSFARELGGELRYKDAEPTGARFTFSLPA